MRLPQNCANRRLRIPSPVLPTSTSSLSGWQSSYPLPEPGTRACRHRPRSAPGSPFPQRSRHAQSPRSTLGSQLCIGATEFSAWRDICAPSASTPVPPHDTSDARACGSPPLPSGAATHGIVDTRSTASPAPLHQLLSSPSSERCD